MNKKNDKLEESLHEIIDVNKKVIRRYKDTPKGPVLLEKIEIKTDQDFKEIENIVLNKYLSLQSKKYKSISQEQIYNDLESNWNSVQEDINYLLEDVLNDYIKDTNIGYLAAFNPFRNTYFSLALIGEEKWTKEKKEILFKKWLNKNTDKNPRGERRIDKGKLFDRVVELEYNEILISPWNNNYFISNVMQDLDLKFGLLIPIIHNDNFLGLFELGFNNLTSARKASFLLNKIVKIVFLPLLLPFTMSMDEEFFIDETCNLFIELFEKFDNGLQKAIKGIEEVKNKHPNIPKLDYILSKLNITYNIRNKYKQKLINPNDQHKKAFTISNKIKEIVASIVTELHYNETIDFRNNISLEYIDFSISNSIYILIPEERIRYILKELILNAFKAIEDLKDEIENKYDLDEYQEVIKYYKKIRNNNSPKVCIKVYRKNMKAIIDIMNNGIEMHDNVYKKAIQFGFSTRYGGSGIGLTIVKRNVIFYNGKIKIYPPPKNPESVDFPTRFQISLPIRV